VLVGFALVLPLAGCQEQPSGTSSPGTGQPSGGGTSARAASDRDDDSNLPVIPLMTEVDGIEIPRVRREGESLDLKSAVPVDLGNPAAADNPTEPVTGGRIVVRINSEPKSMNPITESSAVQSLMGSAVQLALIDQNPETFEFEPLLASRWVTEDSVKLRPDYPGSERYVSLEGKDPAASLVVTFPKQKPDAKSPVSLKFTTYGPDKSPLAKTWVGLFPEEKIVGAPKLGYHRWSGPDGAVSFTGLKPGKYRVRTGQELIGVVERLPDDEGESGVLRLRPESPNNPLSEMLQGEPYFELSADDYIDVQQRTVHTYFLDKRAKWSDGAPYTTKDLEFAHAVINNPIVDGDPIRVYYADVFRCEAVDDGVIQMQYAQQYFQAFEFTGGLAMYGPPLHLFERAIERDLKKKLTFERLTPAQEEEQQKVSVHGAAFGRFFNDFLEYNRTPLGTGPYKIDRWDRSDRIVLKRNENYWNPERPSYLDEIVFKFIPDDNTALSALRAGEIDFLFRMTPEQAYQDLAGPPEWFKKDYIKASWYVPTFSYLGWNLNKPLFQDRRVRIALGLLIDVEEFVEKKLYNEAILTSGSAYIFGPSYDHEVLPLGYDPQVARDLLSEAGWADTDNDGVLDKDGQKFEFRLLFAPGKKEVEDLASVMQENYKRAGISMRIERLEWSSFLEKVQNKDFDVVRLAWLSSIESDPYQIWHSSGAGKESRSSNHVSFSNPDADELIEAFRTAVTVEERSRIYRSFHRLLDREQPYTFLYTSKDFGAYHNRYRGVKWYKIRPGFDLTEWYIPKELQ
jgi:peptide/nickel transport system substrate-binding protein